MREKLGSLGKLMQQAQGRAMDAHHQELRRLGRWPHKADVYNVVTRAAAVQWQMERIHGFAEYHLVVMTARIAA